MLTREDLVALMVAFARGIERRGKVKIGEKTMFDTIYPTAEALQKAFDEGKPLSDMINAGIAAAKQGMESTKDMLSLRGRSSRLGERSIGHIDPVSYTHLDVYKRQGYWLSSRQRSVDPGGATIPDDGSHWLEPSYCGGTAY